MPGLSLFPNKCVMRSEQGGHAGKVWESGGEEEEEYVEEERKRFAVTSHKRAEM